MILNIFLILKNITFYLENEEKLKKTVTARLPGPKMQALLTSQHAPGVGGVAWPLRSFSFAS